MEKDTTDFYVAPHMILTPGAKEYLRNAGRTIIYKPLQQKCECKCESESKNDIATVIKNVLKKEYGLNDDMIINHLTEKILKAL